MMEGGGEGIGGLPPGSGTGVFAASASGASLRSSASSVGGLAASLRAPPRQEVGNE